MRASVYHRGTRVSYSHGVLLRAYEHATKTTLHVNEGRRTLAEQTAFWNAYQRSLRGGPPAPLAAFPSRNAPHIKSGHEHHALDINDGIVDRVFDFYRSKGVKVAMNVPGEAWHMDTTDEKSLIRAAAKLAEAEKWDAYTDKEKSWILEYDRLKRENKDESRRKVLRREMKRQRQRIWRAAQADGWLKNRRRDRYNSLKARTS